MTYKTPKISYFISLGLHIVFLLFLYNFSKNKLFDLNKLEHFEIINAEIVGPLNQTKSEKNISEIKTEESKFIAPKIEKKIEPDLPKQKEQKNIEKPKDEVKAEKLIENIPKKPEKEIKEQKKSETKNEEQLIKEDLLALKKSLNKATNSINNDKTLKLGGGEITTAKLGSYIKSKIIACWKIPPLVGIESEKIYVILQVKLAVDGTIVNMKILNDSQYLNNHFFHVIAESAKQAVYSCSPINGLPADQYKEWRDLELVFDPSKFAN